MSERQPPAAPSRGWSAMNIVFIAMALGAIVSAAFEGSMRAVSDASFQAAKDAVELALSLVGVMAFWLGMMKVLEAGGVVRALGRALQPLLRRLFPEIPRDHPALGAIVMNVSANVFGLGNAATPFGLRAMQELQKLNPIPGTATNAMCLFLAINTSGVTLLPLGAIGVRAAAGSTNPAGIFLPSFLATVCSTLVGIGIALLFARRDRAYAAESAAAGPVVQSTQTDSEVGEERFEHLRVAPTSVTKIIGSAAIVAVLYALISRFFLPDAKFGTTLNEIMSYWLMPLLILYIVSFALIRGVRIYDAVTEGAKQGFEIAIKIIPFLVTILVAVAMFRASGAMDLFVFYLRPLTSWIGMPPEVIPMAIIRPLSGTGAFALMSEAIQQGPDSYPAFLASVMMGASDTTFYILAVYFGSVGIFRVRHAVIAGLAADIAGMIAASMISFWMYPLIYAGQG